ncbi:hypothetical protein [Ponticaulis koreensis]|uniref:hypothetical protein n=1 Tax=Ponticaulis koreensis TaxID=1123045 RepID=UPI0003B58C00|nr:hypothetical protein [Ponticaulis koreensis]
MVEEILYSALVSSEVGQPRGLQFLAGKPTSEFMAKHRKCLEDVGNTWSKPHLYCFQAGSDLYVVRTGSVGRLLGKDHPFAKEFSEAISGAQRGRDIQFSYACKFTGEETLPHHEEFLSGVKASVEAILTRANNGEQLPITATKQFSKASASGSALENASEKIKAASSKGSIAKISDGNAIEWLGERAPSLDQKKSHYTPSYSSRSRSVETKLPETSKSLDRRTLVIGATVAIGAVIALALFKSSQKNDGNSRMR